MQLRFEHVSRHFGQLHAVRDFNTKITPKTITAILGANGAGKSTLLKLIAGWLPVASGRITLGDALIKPSRSHIRKSIHLVDTPKPHESGCTNSIFRMINHYQVDRESLAEEAAVWFERLNLVGVYTKKSRELSKGQRYKIALIGLFLARPHVWLLDEPFSSGLDANGLEVLIHQMQIHASSGGIVVFSTQWPKQAQKLADKIMVIDEGQLVWDSAADVVPAQSLIDSSNVGLQAVFNGIGDRA